MVKAYLQHQELAIIWYKFTLSLGNKKAIEIPLTSAEMKQESQKH